LLRAFGRMILSNRTALVSVVLATFAVCYAGVIKSLFEVWSTNHLYSYGFVVPVIAAYIVRSRPAPLPANPVPDYLLGVPLTLAGCLMLIVANIAALGAIEHVSLVVTLAGLVLLLWGRAAMKRHWFAVTYLLLMVPIWNYPIAALQDPSRHLSARIAAGMLDGIGVPVFRQGTIIALPSHTLSVMQECSGVNQLIALAAMVVPAAYVWLDRVALRVVLLAFAVAITYIGNGLRIAMVGWLAIHGLGDGDPNGKYHLLQGLLVSVLGYGAIGVAFSVLSRFKRSTAPATAPIATENSSRLSPLGRRLWLDVAVIATIAVTGTVRVSATSAETRLQRDLQSLEPSLGGWTMDIAPAVGVRFPAIDDELLGAYPSPTGERRFVQVDDQLIRTYRHASGARVQLYVAYEHRQEQGKEIAGELAAILRNAARPATVDGESGPVAVREVVRDHSGTQRGILFWYDINGRIVPDIYRAKGYTLWDAVTRRRTNGAVVMIAWQGSPLVPASDARQRAIEFARVAMPLLRRHFPS
jgi:EpsI family protein